MVKLPSLIFVIILLSSIIIPTIKLAQADEQDIHYWLKLKLAIYCGYSVNEARLLATGDQGIDNNWATEASKIFTNATIDDPDNPGNKILNIKIKYHALPEHNPVTDPINGITDIKNGQHDLWSKAQSITTNKSLHLLYFGQYLHYLGDKWSHWGYTFEQGHVSENLKRESPDNPGITDRAVKDMIYDTLTQMGSEKGKDSKCFNKNLADSDTFISPANFAGDYLNFYPDGKVQDSTGQSYPDMISQREAYFAKLDSANPDDKISDVYNDLETKAIEKSDAGANLEDVVTTDNIALQNHISKELHISPQQVRENLDFIKPWILRGPFGLDTWLFSSEQNTGIHWGTNGVPKESINPDPQLAFPQSFVNLPNEKPTMPLPPPQIPSPKPGDKFATLVVIKKVFNHGVETGQASDFQINVATGEEFTTSPTSFQGSEDGTTVIISGKFDNLAHFKVQEVGREGYSVSYTEYCINYINAGGTLTCIIYNDYVTPPTSVGESRSGSIFPSWVKKTAGFWSSGQIDDNEFALAIGYLAKEDVIHIHTKGLHDSIISVSGSIRLPIWVKNNALWWSQNQVPDSDFVKAIEYMFDNNLIIFSLKTSTLSTTQDQVSQLSIKVTEQESGRSVAAIITLHGISNAKYVQVLTDMHGQANISVPAGKYSITIDSSDYTRITTTLDVKGNMQKAFQISKSSQQYVKPEKIIPLNPHQSQLQVSASPTTASFIHNVDKSECPELITSVYFISNQQGMWTVSSNPSWTLISLHGNIATVSFNCQLSEYVTQSLLGYAVFQFISSSGETQSVNMTITGQVNQG